MIPRKTFPYYGIGNKLWKLDFPLFFYSVSILWKDSNVSSAVSFTIQQCAKVCFPYNCGSFSLWMRPSCLDKNTSISSSFTWFAGGVACDWSPESLDARVASDINSISPCLWTNQNNSYVLFSKQADVQCTRPFMTQRSWPQFSQLVIKKIYELCWENF